MMRVLPSSICGVRHRQTAEGLVCSAMAADVCTAVSAEIRGVAEAAAIDLGIIDQRGFVAAVIAINGQGFFDSLY